MTNQRVALGIDPTGKPIAIRLTDAGALGISGASDAGNGAIAVDGVLLLGLSDSGRFVPLAVDASGNLQVGTGGGGSGTTIIQYLNNNYYDQTYINQNYYDQDFVDNNYFTQSYITNNYISNTLVTVKGQLIGGKGNHQVDIVVAGTEGQLLIVRAAETTGLKFETQQVVVPFIIDGGGQAITAGIKGDFEIPFAGVVTAVRTVADQTGSIVLDLWKDTFAHFPPVVGDSMIPTGTKPTLSNEVTDEVTSFTGWLPTVAAGDWIRVNAEATPATVTRVTLSITIARS